MPGEGERAEPRRCAARLAEIEGVDLVCRLEGADGVPLRREEPGMPPAGGEWAVVERARRAQLRFRPGDEVADLRGGALGGRGRPRGAGGDGRGRAPAQRDLPGSAGPRLVGADGPHAGDFIVSLELGFEAVDWGGVTHAGGGSHGSLHAGDSLGPLLFVGCGPESADEREQWTLRDVAPVVLEHFGLRARA